jgi:hypothetical protein
LPDMLREYRPTVNCISSDLICAYFCKKEIRGKLCTFTSRLTFVQIRSFSLVFPYVFESRLLRRLRLLAMTLFCCFFFRIVIASVAWRSLVLDTTVLAYKNIDYLNRLNCQKKTKKRLQFVIFYDI